MPIYVYACKDCGEVEEHIQRFSDPPLTECDRCGGRLQKQITSASFHLKGGGWYKDGYASAKSDGGDSGGGDSGGGDSGGGDSGGSEAKKDASKTKDASKAKASSGTDSSGSSGASSSSRSSAANE